MDENSTLKLIDKNGKENKYTIITSFYLDSTKKHYIVYTDNVKDTISSMPIYASIFYPDDNTKLEKIETEEEWNAIESILNNLKVNG